MRRPTRAVAVTEDAMIRNCALRRDACDAHRPLADYPRLAWPRTFSRMGVSSPRLERFRGVHRRDGH
jgi:hypothetical protein